jgi:hypothetical protein
VMNRLHDIKISHYYSLKKFPSCSERLFQDLHCARYYVDGDRQSTNPAYYFNLLILQIFLRMTITTTNIRRR